MQHFLLEVINSGPVSPPPSYPPSSSAGAGDLEDNGGVHKTVLFDVENNNELSTLNDQVRRKNEQEETF